MEPYGATPDGLTIVGEVARAVAPELRRPRRDLATAARPLGRYGEGHHARRSHDRRMGLTPASGRRAGGHRTESRTLPYLDGDTESWANAVSDDGGVIVGSSRLINATSAAIWTANTGPQDLNTVLRQAGVDLSFVATPRGYRDLAARRHRRDWPPLVHPGRECVPHRGLACPPPRRGQLLRQLRRIYNSARSERR